MNRYAYKEKIETFLSEDIDEIFGKIVKDSENSKETKQQLNTWTEEIKLLKNSLNTVEGGSIAFEYIIPRIGKRVDAVLLYKGIIFILEFKVGEKEYKKYEIDQVEDYALDLKNFHKESFEKYIVPILICTSAKNTNKNIGRVIDKVHTPVLTNGENLRDIIDQIILNIPKQELDNEEWFQSKYYPTPTIIEAAQYMYNNKSVQDISRNDAGIYNLEKTSNIIKNIIKDSKRTNKKSICFITGVPGAGKTLAGLNIANETQDFVDDEHAVFLSGNFLLVKVLQEALARDSKSQNKSEALRKSQAFIQIIHHFRDDAVNTIEPPHEKVAIFDEAQRAWDEKQLSDFMKRKKGIPDFKMSEPEFLIEYMNRHKDWSVIICLIGGGQEINTGEVGLEEWFRILANKYTDWNVYVSNKIYDREYTNGKDLKKMFSQISNLNIKEELHLAVSTRSFRSEKQADLIKAILDLNIEKAKTDYNLLRDKYPIIITRDLEKAKKWIKTMARGTERIGMTATSGAKRLRKNGIYVDSNIDVVSWFLNTKDDVRSSYALEQVATEFEIQGLELDWSIVAWDANLRLINEKWEYYNFVGSRWNKINKEERIKYLINSYRVILTRARQGMVIYIPYGDEQDKTALPEFYNGVYEYIKRIGIKEL